MKILITGVHGYIGSNFVQAFGGKHQIYGLDIVAPVTAGVIKTFNWNELSVLPEVDVVIHLAGKKQDTKNQRYAGEYFQVNSGLTKVIYNWFLKSEASKFLFFSSVKAAAFTADQIILTENAEPSPRGPLGESKLDAEKYLLGLMESNALSENNSFHKKTYILRPSMIYGPGNKGSLFMLFNIVNKGFPWPLGAFENVRSFTSIDNLIFIIDKLIDSDIPQGIYNIADDESLSTNELIRLISSTLKNPLRILYVNRKIITTFASIGKLLNFPLNTESLRKLTENYIVSNTKIKSALNIDKLPYLASDGIVKTIKSFTL